jgi:hypothetical protein
MSDPRDLNTDPRFRYPYNRPPTYTEQTSPFYLPLQRDMRFETLTYYPINNECWYKLPHGEPCNTNQDCLTYLERNCDAGEIEFVNYQCTNRICEFDIENK